MFPHTWEYSGESFSAQTCPGGLVVYGGEGTAREAGLYKMLNKVGLGGGVRGENEDIMMDHTWEGAT